MDLREVAPSAAPLLLGAPRDPRTPWYLLPRNVGWHSYPRLVSSRERPPGSATRTCAGRLGRGHPQRAMHALDTRPSWAEHRPMVA